MSASCCRSRSARCSPPKFWHAHYGKVAAFWACLTLAAIAVGYGVCAALAAFVHAMLGEYMSFIILLFALYTVAGGLLITGNLGGTPREQRRRARLRRG